MAWAVGDVVCYDFGLEEISWGAHEGRVTTLRNPRRGDPALVPLEKSDRTSCNAARTSAMDGGS